MCQQLAANESDIKLTLTSETLTSHFNLKEKMVLNTKKTQKIGHTTSPSQKIRESAPEFVLRLSVCEEMQNKILFHARQ